MTLDPVSLEDVPYLNLSVVGNRRVPLKAYWDGGQWFTWQQTDRGLLRLRPLDVALSEYVAKEAARESDIWIPFVDLMWQRASWPKLLPITRAICADFQNLFTSVAKIHHAHVTRATLGPVLRSTFVSTELEYIITVSRGIFDLVQESISIIWADYIVLHDPDADARRRKRRLPTTFSKMCLSNKQLARTGTEIHQAFGVPRTLADCYEAHSPFFVALRSVRDRVVHGLSPLPNVYSTDRGFVVHPGESPFDQFGEWKDEHRFNDATVSLLPWLSHVVLGTVHACSELMTAFAAEIELPPELAPGFRVFIRSENSSAVKYLLDASRGLQYWWTDEEGDTRPG